MICVWWSSQHQFFSGERPHARLVPITDKNYVWILSLKTKNQSTALEYSIFSRHWTSYLPLGVLITRILFYELPIPCLPLPQSVTNLSQTAGWSTSCNFHTLIVFLLSNLGAAGPRGLQPVLPDRTGVTDLEIPADRAVRPTSQLVFYFKYVGFSAGCNVWHLRSSDELQGDWPAVATHCRLYTTQLQGSSPSTAWDKRDP